MADADGHDFPGLVDELVPCVATVVDDVVVGFEDAVRKPIVADELPDVFLRVQLGAFGWQRDQGDVGGDLQAAGKMPSGLIEKKDGVPPGRDLGGDLGKMEIHRLGVASRHDERRAFALSRTDRAEDIGRGGPLIDRSARA